MDWKHLNYRPPSSGEYTIDKEQCSECWEHKELLPKRGYCAECKESMAEYNALVNGLKRKRTVGDLRTSRYKVIDGKVILVGKVSRDYNVILCEERKPRVIYY